MKEKLLNNNFVTSTSNDVVSPDSVCWYPMRVSYGRGVQVKSFLDKKSIDNFLPIKTETVYDGDSISFKETPSVSNLIFVHSSKEIITQLKRGYEELSPLRYMTYHPLENPTENKIITVPDRQMDNFIKACKGPADSLAYLSPDELLGKAQRKVEIISGPFQGVEGVIKRIHGNRSVVVELEGLCGVQLKMVGKSQMRVIVE